jgi:transposase
MPRKPRRSFTPEQKATLLARHYVEKVPVSQLCEENDLQPSVFYYWQKQLFENAPSALQPGAAAASKQLVGKIEALEQQLARKDSVIAKKDEVIAWVTEEHIKLKKALGEP